MALDVPAELVIPGVVCAGTVTSATLPVRSRSPVAVLCAVCVDAVTVDGRSCNTDSHCSFTVIQQNLNLSPASSDNIQVSIVLLL